MKKLNWSHDFLYHDDRSEFDKNTMTLKMLSSLRRKNAYLKGSFILNLKKFKEISNALEKIKEHENLTEINKEIRDLELEILSVSLELSKINRTLLLLE